MSNKNFLRCLGLALIIVTSSFGCSKNEASVPVTPQGQAAAESQAAADAQKNMARDKAMQQAQQADAARRGAQ